MTRYVTKIFIYAGDFAATSAAEKWCEENGISVGRMQAGSPRGLLYGEYDIQKWRNLDDNQRDALDGEMTGDGRNGPVFVRIRAKAEIS